MGGGIYLIQDSGGLVELNERQYEAEELLQKLLAEYPNLLAGDQIDPTAPRRWLLISREMAIPDVEGGAGRWALDHLFLDQDGVPTLVEVKRSSDTRLRREVVGQMLDYAANAVVNWPAETIQAQFEANCQSMGRDPSAMLMDFLGEVADPDSFWTTVKRNHQAGRIRMVFVADVIPSELRRIVEFLNGQMDPAEVIAIEIRQFVGQGLKALVPKVVGQTATAQQAKSKSGPRTSRRWDEPTFLDEIETTSGLQAREVAQDILNWTHREQLQITWGSGKDSGRVFPKLKYKGTVGHSISVWTDGSVHIEFRRMADASHGELPNPFIVAENRLKLLAKLNDIPGIAIPEEEITHWPEIKLAKLVDRNVRRQFLDVLDWLIVSIRRGQLVEE